jgi:hypothetical protein
MNMITSTISKKRLFEGHEICIKMLLGSTTDYPKETEHQIITIFLMRGTKEGEWPKTTVSEYFKSGNDHPANLLRDIINTHCIITSVYFCAQNCVLF